MTCGCLLRVFQALSEISFFKTQGYHNEETNLYRATEKLKYPHDLPSMAGSTADFYCTDCTERET